MSEQRAGDRGGGRGSAAYRGMRSRRQEEILSQQDTYLSEGGMVMSHSAGDEANNMPTCPGSVRRRSLGNLARQD